MDPIWPRFPAADEVIIGQPIGARLIGQRWFVDIVVEETLQGPLRPKSTVAADSGQLGGSFAGKGRRGILFLQGNPQTGFKLIRATGVLGGVEALYYVTPIKTPPPAGSRRGAARIVFEIVEALKSPDLGFARHFLHTPVSELCGRPLADPVIEELRNSPEPGNRALSVALGLCRGSTDSIAQLRGDLAALLNSPARGAVRGALSSIETHNPHVLGLFRDIVTSTQPAVRYAIPAVASNLEKIHSRDSVPMMVQLLDDDQPRVREAVLVGLSRFVDGYPPSTRKAVLTGAVFANRRRTEFATAETGRFNAATTRPPESEQAEYVAAWKRWWRESQAKLAY